MKWLFIFLSIAFMTCGACNFPYDGVRTLEFEIAAIYMLMLILTWGT